MIESTEFGTCFILLVANVVSQFIFYLFFRFADGVCYRMPLHADPLFEPGYERPSRSLLAQYAHSKLNTDTFVNLKQKETFLADGTSTAKNHCCICLVEFENSDIATSMRCDERHIFHEGCLRRALEYKLACPICRSPCRLLLSHPIPRRAPVPAPGQPTHP